MRGQTCGDLLIAIIHLLRNAIYTFELGTYF